MSERLSRDAVLHMMTQYSILVSTCTSTVATVEEEREGLYTGNKCFPRELTHITSALMAKQSCIHTQLQGCGEYKPPLHLEGKES